MSLEVKQKIIRTNGKSIILPGWCGGQEGDGLAAIPDPYVKDSRQVYPAGTIFLDSDRVFHYGYVDTEDAAATKANIGLFCSVVSFESLTMDAVAYAAGVTEVVIEDTVATLNEYAGGFFMPRTNPYGCFKILSNTATSGGHVTLTLERGTLSALTASQGSNKLIGNKYSKMGCTWAAGRDDVSWLGITLVDITAARWQWLQTYGPCAVVPYNEEIGASAGARQAVYHIDGTARSYVANYQIMGFGIPHSGTTSTWWIQVNTDPGL